MYKLFQFNLGREALLYIVKYYGIEKLFIPYYLCDVIRHTLVKAGCKPVFYHIDDRFLPDMEFNQNDYILYPNYFGICSKNVKLLTKKYNRLIVDNAHAYYDKPMGLACFNAGHKFGFQNSTLWIKGENFNQETSLFKLNPKLRELALQRNKLFCQLHQEYKTDNQLEITDLSSGPFAYPYLARTAEDADNLVKILNKKGKTVYRYWSPLPKTFNEYKFYSRLVPIPVLP